MLLMTAPTTQTAPAALFTRSGDVPTTTVQFSEKGK